MGWGGGGGGGGGFGVATSYGQNGSNHPNSLDFFIFFIIIFFKFVN
jgi:hypothetical protein